MQNKKQILVTGSAGFIGFSVSKKLLEDGVSVIGVDCLNHYYDVSLKKARNRLLKKNKNYKFIKLDLCDVKKVGKLFSENEISAVCHLAAQAGVRYSLTHPLEYKTANMDAFMNLIEEAKNAKADNFVYASSSSVYGDTTRFPFSEADPCVSPVSLYGATKRANELIACSYSRLFRLPTTGLRFFTVYGPWGRPDMALFLFAKAITEGRPIDVYNYGNMRRSFTYIDDVVSGVIACLRKPFPCEVFNLGSDRSETLMSYIEILEKKLGKTARKNMLPLQPGDIEKTEADISRAREKLGYEPRTRIWQGIEKFVEWYRQYYRV